jgi:hypothetical protein
VSTSRKAATVRTFVPEKWGELDLFAKFYAGTYTLSNEPRKALSGVSGHFHKASLLLNMARKHVPNLAADDEQLRLHGFTPGHNSREFAALVESVFTEAYSAIDCTRKVIVATYSYRPQLPDSTRKLMQRVKAGEVAANFPEPLRQAILSTHWYEELLEIRDALTHSDVGSCRWDSATGLISYSHRGIKVKGNPLLIENIVGKLEETLNDVNAYMGAVFSYLNSTLKPYDADQMCGVFNGRMYMRKLRWGAPIDLNSGVCQSRSWFTEEEGYFCPLANSCKAFTRAELE